jgi:hypothetical protein
LGACGIHSEEHAADNAAHIAAFNPQAMAPVLSLAREGLRGRPEGWRLVPLAATNEMSLAGHAATEKYIGRVIHESFAPVCWDAMLAAAPPAPGGK